MDFSLGAPPVILQRTLYNQRHTRPEMARNFHQRNRKRPPQERKPQERPRPVAEDPAAYAVARLLTPRARFPPEMEVHQPPLGKGSNNKVYRVTIGGQDLALRVPRRKSDTQQRGSAVWEFRHTLKASQLGVGALVYDAWCAKHAHEGWPSGLYVLTELLDHDLDAVLCDDPALRARAAPHGAAIGAAFARCLHTLSKERILMYDLKPGNIMLRLPPDKDAPEKERRGGGGGGGSGGVDVRIIDFGRDFTEWEGAEHEPDARTPVITMLRKLIAHEGYDEATREAVLTHVLFAAMLVQAAATTTHRIFIERDDHRMGGDERRACNVLAPLAARLLDSMQGRHLALLRRVLRSDEVRGVLRHYLGRRNAGTRRTLRFARGIET
jgi:hypothetical protein